MNLRKFWNLFLLLLSFYFNVKGVKSDGNGGIANQPVDESELIEVRIKFEGKELVLSFPKTRLDAIEMASKLCHERFTEEGEDDARKTCIRKVGEYLIDQVDKKSSFPAKESSSTSPRSSERDQIHLLQLTIQGSSYDLEINPSRDNFHTVSRSFCLKHQQTFNIQPQDLDQYCVAPVRSVLILCGNCSLS